MGDANPTTSDEDEAPTGGGDPVNALRAVETLLAGIQQDEEVAGDGAEYYVRMARTHLSRAVGEVRDGRE